MKIFNNFFIHWIKSFSLVAPFLRVFVFVYGYWIGKNDSSINIYTTTIKLSGSNYHTTTTNGKAWENDDDEDPFNGDDENIP